MYICLKTLRQIWFMHTYILYIQPWQEVKVTPFPATCVRCCGVRAAEIQYTASHKPFSHRILRSFTCHWNSVYLTCTTYCDTHTHIHIYPASVQSYLWAAYFRKKLLLLLLVCVGGRFAPIAVCCFAVVRWAHFSGPQSLISLSVSRWRVCKRLVLSSFRPPFLRPTHRCLSTSA